MRPSGPHEVPSEHALIDSADADERLTGEEGRAMQRVGQGGA